jgi:outer membrane protein OmpA-like peptidoglycan-associated protein
MILKNSMILLLAILSLSAYPVTNPVLNESGQVGLKQVISAQTLGISHLSLFFDFSFSSTGNQIHRLIVPKDLQIGFDTLQPKYTLCALNPAISFGITEFLDAAIHMPLYFDIMENFAPEAGFGGLEIDLKLRTPVPNENMFQSALYASFSFPTGNQSSGFLPRRFWDFNDVRENSDSITHEISGTYGNKKPEFSPLILLSFCTPRIKIHGNGGVRLTLNREVDQVLLMACGFEFCPARNLTLFADIQSMNSFEHIRDGFQLNEDYLRWSPGVTIRSNSGLSFTVSGDFDLSAKQSKFFYDFNDRTRKIEAESKPSWGVTVQIGWNDFLKRPDRDGDLINDANDKCPDQKEDFDQFEDADGCPDTDNDNDGIPDVNDSCRNIPEDKDGVLDEDGCPDFDNDLDNIADSVDNCPMVSEDFDGFEDNDGCPDYDNDADGMPDSLDKCPMVPEDHDDFEDNDGCPDLDNDLDGVFDSLDKCPQKAGNPKLDGCPGDVPEPKEIKFGRVILKGVDFGSGSSLMSEGSYSILDQVIASLKEWLEIQLEIQVHSDNSGDPESNLQLCQKRADEICKYLIGKGISSDRLVPIGKGGTDPIADNNTVAGRKINTRVEIHRKN